MDIFASFYDSIKSRFENPLIFSFFLVWIIHNWPITFGLFFLEAPPDIPEHLYFFKYVSEHLNTRDSFCIPLFWASVYTIGFPFLKLGLTAFSTWIGTISDRCELYILKGKKISIDKFMTLRKELIQKQGELQSAIEKEDEYRREAVLHRENFDTLTERYRILALGRDLQWIQGAWNFRSGDVVGSTPDITGVLLFKGDNVDINEDGIRKPHATLVNFFRDLNHKTVQFSFLGPRIEKNDSYAADRLMYYYDLREQADDTLTGIEYGDYEGAARRRHIRRVHFKREEFQVIHGGAP
jgi:hypothetical protein